jgi:hypothetical protein
MSVFTQHHNKPGSLRNLKHDGDLPASPLFTVRHLISSDFTSLRQRQVNERDRPTSVRWRRELDGYDMWRKQDDDNEHWPATRASTRVA